MTPEEYSTLGWLGTRVLAHIAQAITAFTLYGVYFVVFVLSARILLRQSKGRQTRTILLLVLSVILFISTTLRFASWCSFIVIQMTGLFGTSQVPLPGRRPFVKARLTKFDIILYFCRSINLLISDIIAVWRAWVLYQHSVWPKILLSVISIVNAGLLLAVASMDAVIAAGSNPAISATIFADVLSASSFVSSGTNLTASLFIGIKAWKHRRTMKEALKNYKKGTIDKVFRMLVETGVAFAILQLVDAILAVSYIDSVGAPSSRALPAGIFDEIVIALAAIYPVLVIILVQDNKTVIHSTIQGNTPDYDDTSSSEQRDEEHLTTMRFAQTTTDNESSAGGGGKEGKDRDIEPKKVESL